MSVPYVVGSDTSQAAAGKMEPIVNTVREHVFAYVQSTGDMGATSDEIEAGTDMRHQTVSARLRELKLDGRIIDSGKRRPTRSGRNAAVMIVPSAPVL